MKRCGGCSLFLQEECFDHAHCVGCRRGGYICHGTSTTEIEAPRHSAFLTSAAETLQRTSSKCNYLIANSVDQSSNRLTAATLDYGCSSNLPWEEAQILDAILEIDHKLERLCQLNKAECESCRNRKIRCSKLTQRRPRQRRAFSTSLELLLPVPEVDEVSNRNESSPDGVVECLGPKIT